MRGAPKGGKGAKGGKSGGGGKGGNKDGGKFVGSVWLPQNMYLKNKSANGKSICFKYSKGICVDANCKMEHICQLCEEKHKWQECALLD